MHEWVGVAGGRFWSVVHHSTAVGAEAVLRNSGSFCGDNQRSYWGNDGCECSDSGPTSKIKLGIGIEWSKKLMALVLEPTYIMAGWCCLIGGDVNYGHIVCVHFLLLFSFRVFFKREWIITNKNNGNQVGLSDLKRKTDDIWSAVAKPLILEERKKLENNKINNAVCNCNYI